jgi:predicted phage-related endonuclease
VAQDRSLQLGFIIEDLPSDSPFVTEDRRHVNLYAYTSAAVAAIQELKEQLAKQDATIKELKEQLEHHNATAK